MRKRVLLFVLASVLMSVCIPVIAQQPQNKLPQGLTKEEVMKKIPGLVIDDEGNATQDGKPVEIISLDYYSGKPQQEKEEYLDFSGMNIDPSRLNQDAFKLPEGKTVEELVRSLPGVEILDDGSIMLNGKQVPRLLINGKLWFPEHEYVDLGLSVKWATCNLGATKPEEYGNLYAWGETVTKYENGYSWDNYIYCNGSNSKLTKYCKDRKYGDNGFTDNKTTLDPEDDAANINWGDNWRIPTADEWQELLDSCIMSPRTLNGVWGAFFTSTVPGYEDHSIFLPFAGGTFLSNPGGTQGNYWSSTLGSFYPLGVKDDLICSDDDAYIFSIDFYGGKGLLNQMRMCGFSIRPVQP